MNIIVFIKQIPDSDEVKLDENGNLIRSGAGTMINPVDKNALEAGLSLRDRFGGKVTASLRPRVWRRRHPRNRLCSFHGRKEARQL